MTYALIVIGFLCGAGIVFFVLRSRMLKATGEIAVEQARAKVSDEARQKFEIDLAATRPEANRAAQLGIQLGQVNDRNSELSNECASLTTMLSERDKALAEERLQSAITREDLKQEIKRLMEKRDVDAARIVELEVEKSALSASIGEREQSLLKERGQLAELSVQFRAQFAELSALALKDNSENFLATAKKVLALQHQEADTDLAKRQEEIKQLVKPLQDGIKAVGDAAKEMESRREKTFGTIEEQLKQSVLHSAEVARQASALKDALKRPNVRGRWGEVQLMNCIELAGMAEHCDVKFQNSSVSTENDRIRPDMEVYMPGGRKVVVDAKTPMDYFLQYIEATTDEDRTSALIRHAKAVKSHVSDLAKIDYMQKVARSPDFVVMFLPNESFLAMALEREPEVMQEALDKKVLIATPATLIGLLKVIRYGWNEQRQTDSARKITEEGAKLNTQITSFLLDFAKLGAALKTASELYGTSVQRVEKQIAASSHKLTSWGAKSRKKLSKPEARLLDAGDLEDIDLEDSEESATSVM